VVTEFTEEVKRLGPNPLKAAAPEKAEAGERAKVHVA